MFKDLPEGQTHYENDGCGEPAHNKGFKPSDFEKSWEKQYDAMIAPLTESTADIKQFIHQLLDEERKRIAQEFADLDIILKKKPNIPMGVSQWRNYGIKYDYYNYFAKQEREKAFREILDIMRKKHLDSDIYNNFFIDLAEEIRQLNKI